MNMSREIEAASLPAPEGASLRESGPAAAGERGRTTVSALAVEQIAGRLAAQCPDVGGTSRRVLGVAAGERRREAVVTARLHGTAAVSLAVRCSVPYPRAAARAAQALRDLLTVRVGELTGLRVQRVDIIVTELTASTAGRRVE